MYYTRISCVIDVTAAFPLPRRITVVRCLFLILRRVFFQECMDENRTYEFPQTNQRLEYVNAFLFDRRASWNFEQFDYAYDDLDNEARRREK